MTTTANATTNIYTPGCLFRGLNADKTLHELYGRDNSVNYETVADSFNFFSNATIFGLESPLGETGQDGGYFVHINRQQWAELLTQSPNVVPNNFAANPDWQRIIAFADKWYTSGLLRDRLIDGLWFEVDVSGPPEAIPIPSVFFGVVNSTVDGSIAATMAGLAALNVAVSPKQSDLLARYFQVIAPLCSSFQLGVMLSRPAAPVRLCAFNASLPDVLEGLKILGITTLEDYPDFQQEFSHLAPLFSAVDLDIGDEFGIKVGLELMFSSVATIREQQQNRPAYLEWLVQKGWCLPQRNQAVLNWVGGNKYHPDPEDFWSPRKTIFRTISHIKLDFQPGKPPRAKAYLEYTA